MLNLWDIEKLWLNIRAFCKLRKEEGTIFYIQKVHYHIAAPFLLNRLGKNKFILDYDDWDIDRSPLFNPLLNYILLKHWSTEGVTRHIASKALACIASSKYLVDFLSKFNRNVFYIPTGVDTAKFRRQNFVSSKEKVTFVWTGQVWGKIIYDNLLFLLDCFSELNRRYPNIELKIIGSGGWMPKVKKIIKRDYGDCNVEVIGWIDPDKMPDFLSTADIGLLSLIPDKKNELWIKSKSPTKLFEYMAMGMPTVSTAIGEIPHIINDGEEGFLANNREEFIQGMEALIADKNLRREMGIKARKKAEEEYSLDVIGKQLCEILQKVIAL
jgi:glycosyltransferase involved in cell wall biosynthesis